MGNEISLGVGSTGWEFFGLSPNSSFPWEIHWQNRTDFMGDFVLSGFV